MMAHAFDRHNFAKSEASWLAIEKDRKIEVRSQNIRAQFEFLADRSILIRIRSADKDEPFASLSCDFGALLDLFERFCDSTDFRPLSDQEATVHALSHDILLQEPVEAAGDASDLQEAYDTGSRDICEFNKSVAQLRKLRSFDKFNDEIRALTQIEQRLRGMMRAFSGLMDRYEWSKFNRGIIMAPNPDE
jgi:hypothetical protein